LFSTLKAIDQFSFPGYIHLLKGCRIEVESPQRSEDL